MRPVTYWTGQLPSRARDAASREINALSQRAAQLGLGPLTLEATGRATELNGPALALEEYALRAMIDHRPDPPLVRILPGPGGLIDAAHWADLPPRCDHCGLNRARRHTALLVDRRTGVLQQVGTSCLRAATRHSDPVRVIRHGEYVAAAIAYLDEHHQVADALTDTRLYLARVIELSRRDGFVTLADATGDRLATSEAALASDEPPTAQALERADGVLGWASQERAAWQPELGDFAARVRAATGHRQITVGEAHLVAHAPAQRLRDLAAQRKVSRHQGTPGAELLLTVHVQDSRAAGRGWLTTLRDQAGNRYSVFTGHSPEWSVVGTTVHLEATVDRHDELRSGERVTVLRRPRALTIEGPRA